MASFHLTGRGLVIMGLYVKYKHKTCCGFSLLDLLSIHTESVSKWQACNRPVMKGLFQIMRSQLSELLMFTLSLQLLIDLFILRISIFVFQLFPL